MEDKNPIIALAEKTGTSKVTIYKRLKELGRLPTEEECRPKKAGRKRIYNY